MFQNTLAKSVTIEGIGVHNGRDIEMIISPAEVNTGIEFYVESEDNVISKVKANIENINCGRLCTVIKSGATSVKTIEHLMAAFYALNITNAKVFIKGGDEVPIMDGSSKEFVEAMKKAGVKQQNAMAKVFTIENTIKVECGNSFIIAKPSSELTINYEIDFDHPVIGKQSYKLENVKSFLEDISSARTFGMVNQVSELRKQGYARGASLDNAIALDDENILNPEGLRYKDEFVRHKILDSIGDFYLIGGIIKAEIYVYKGSHHLNHLFIKEFFKNAKVLAKQEYKEELIANIPAGLATVAVAG